LRIEIDQIDDKSSELSGMKRPGQQAQAVFELPKIMPQSQKPFKGFLDLSLTTKRLKKLPGASYEQFKVQMKIEA